jgi:hypothetical protein
MDAITITAIATCIAGIAALITAIILAIQTGAFTAAAKANALAARIEYYYAQVETHKNSPLEQRKLKDQQVHLVYQLDEVLDKLKVGTGKHAKLSPHDAKVPHWEYKPGHEVLREQSQH